MVAVNGSTITMTRGDTLMLNVSLKNADGTDYIPQSGDALRFAMRENFDKPVCIVKEIDVSSMVMEITPAETKKLKACTYLYDIELTDTNERVSTVVSGKLNLLMDVY